MPLTVPLQNHKGGYPEPKEQAYVPGITFLLIYFLSFFFANMALISPKLNSNTLNSKEKIIAKVFTITSPNTRTGIKNLFSHANFI